MSPTSCSYLNNLTLDWYRFIDIGGVLYKYIGSLFHLYAEGNSEPCHILFAFSWYLFFFLYSFSISGFSWELIFLYSIYKAGYSSYLLFWYSICFSQCSCYFAFWYIILLSGFSWYLHFTYNSVSLQNFLDTLLFFFICNIWCSILLTFFLFVLFYRFFLIIISPFHFLFWIFIFSFWKIKISLPVCWQPPLFQWTFYGTPGIDNAVNFHK